MAGRSASLLLLHDAHPVWYANGISDLCIYSRRLCIFYSPSTVLILALFMTGYVTPQFDTKFNSARALSITAIVSTYLLTFVILFI